VRGLIQAHLRHEESVDDIERAQLEIDFAIDGQHQLARDNIVFAVLVGWV
jgi:hypothetical protein